MKLIKMAFLGMFALTLMGTSLSADAVKGQKLYSKFLKKSCDMTGAKFAAIHSQDEWKQIKEAGAFEAEIIKICPNVKEGEIKESIQEHIFDFSFEFANDSGNVPAC
uniref:cytochrome C n=1 Tax=Aliarcobacter sp. TaxID=2321116 RepID=UPI0040488A43